MEQNDYFGKILSIDEAGTEIKDDAFSVDYDEFGNYILNVYVSNPYENIDELAEYFNKIRAKNSYVDSYSIKSSLKECSLSEREEKDCFCFSFLIDKVGKVIDFTLLKRKIEIDIEMDRGDVFDTVEEEGALCDYLIFINGLSDLLYAQRNNGKEFVTYGKYIDYDITFPREFTFLVNQYIAEKFQQSQIPFIYDVKEYERYNYHSIGWYYTSTPTKSSSSDGKIKYYYGAFTSPLQNYEDLKNLEILSAFLLQDNSKDEFESLKQKYNDELKDYIRLKEDKTEEYRIPKRGRK